MSQETDGESPGESRWRWLILPVSIAILSRVYSIALVIWLGSRAQPWLTEGVSPLAAWDSEWYLRIARDGYHAAAINPGQHDFAFFPAWPALIRIVSLDGGLPMDVAAVFLANLLFVLASVCVFRLFAHHFGTKTATLGTLLLSLNPASYVFSMAYSEPLFLTLAALYFLDRYGRLSPVFAGLATLVRVTGLAIAVSAAVMFVLRRAARVRLLLIGGTVAVAFAAWWIYIWQLTGSFAGWFEGSPSWPVKHGLDSIAFIWGQHRSWVIEWLFFVGLMAVGSLVLLRKHPDMAVYGLAAIAMSLVGAPAWSMPRHAMAAFPAFAALADRLGTRLSLALAVIFAIGEFLFVTIAFGAAPRAP